MSDLVSNKRYNTPQEAFEARTIPAPETGCLLWTGAVDEGGYGLINVYGKLQNSHIFAWIQVNGRVPKGMKLDHKCYTPACCHPEHLRLATHQENMRNRKGPQKNNKSGYRNIWWDKVLGKWRVQLSLDGKNLYFGSYSDLEEAVEVRDRERIKLYGEFAGGG